MSPSAPEAAIRPIVHVVDDDEAVRDALAVVLRTRGFQVRQYASGDLFLSALPGLEPGCVVTDVQMPGVSGIELVAALRAKRPDWPVIVISGRSTAALARQALALGAETLLEKPFSTEDLVAAIRRAA